MNAPPDKLPGRFGGFARAQRAERPTVTPETVRSPRQRGYGYRWDRLSRAYAKQNPWCEECARRGVDEIGMLRDHIIPTQDRPDLMLVWDNLQNLCKLCHDVWKRRLETFARDTGQVDLLPMWVKRPETRPRGFEMAAGGEGGSR